MASVEEQIKTANADLASLGRVFHKLAMVDTSEKLTQVLDKLTPRLLKRIGDNHQNQLQASNINSDTLKRLLKDIHTKLVEMLTHIMKRVRNDTSVKLPCFHILQLLLEQQQDEKKDEQESATMSQQENNDVNIPKALQHVDPFTLNLTLTFLTLGLPRCTPNELEQLLPVLIVLLGQYSGVESLQSASKKSQSFQIAHLLLRAIEQIVIAEEETNKALYGSFKKKLKSEYNSGGANIEAITQARNVCHLNQQAASALYDLLLDVILYQTVAGNVPPPGLSQAGNERLKQGSSSTARDWSAEMAPPSRLKQLKERILDFIAPTRRWGLFVTTTTIKDAYNSKLGMARTVSLLVAANGDEHVDVAQRASTYLKQHLDLSSSQTDQNSKLFGDAAALVFELLTLSVGATNAELVLKNIPSSSSSGQTITTLGQQFTSTNPSQQQLVLSLKRRMVSKQTFGSLGSYITKILDDTINLLTDLNTACAIGNLAVLAATQSLTKVTTMSGLSTLRAKPYIAASQMLNSLVIRLSKLDDPKILKILSNALSITCSVLSTASNSIAQTSGTRNVIGEGNKVVRDQLYGVISALSRSPLANDTLLFSKGSNTTSITDGALSTDTAVLLFGCVANEDETLLPRASAALDALLAAYCRIYISNDGVKRIKISKPKPQESYNPWSNLGNTASSSSEAATRGTGNDNLVDLRQPTGLIPLIWSAGQGSQRKASRVAATRWSSDLLKKIDIPNACHLLCFLSGDADPTAASMARLGLGLDTKTKKAEKDEEDSPSNLPDFGELTTLLFSGSMETSTSTFRPTYWDFSPQGKATAVKLLLKCLLGDLYGGEDTAVRTYLTAITRTLTDVATQAQAAVELLEEAANALSVCLSTSLYARTLVSTKQLDLDLRGIELLALSSTSSQARRSLAETCGYLYKDEDLWTTTTTTNTNNWGESIKEAMTLCAEKISNNLNNNSVEVHGASFLGAQCVRAFRLHCNLAGTHEAECWSLASIILDGLGNGTVQPDDITGNAFADGLAIALSYYSDDAPILNEHLYRGTTSALLHLEAALKKYGGSDHTNAPRASKLAHAAGICLAASTTAAGYVSESASDNLGQARLQCVSALYGLLGSPAFRQDEELALLTGEALAIYADAYSPNDVVWSSTAEEWPKEYDEEFANKLPPHQQVLYTLLRRIFLEHNPHKRTSCAPALLAVIARAASKSNRDPKYANRSLVKEIALRLEDIQRGFIQLLADPKSKHLSRESCCLGLAACRGLADVLFDESENNTQLMNEKLLRAFGQTSKHGGSAMMETRAQATERRRAEGMQVDGTDLTEPTDQDTPMEMETEVGGASGMGEAALGAYREMASAAVALGQSDVLYALLMLSVSNFAWFATGRNENYSANALLGEKSIIGSRTNAGALRAALRPHIGKLLPKLLRASHDPNKQTREQISNLWLGLTGGGAEARQAITEHLLPTIDALIEEASSKLWRSRVGACGALAEIIVARSWEALGGGTSVLDDDDVVSKVNGSTTIAGVRLLRLWRVAMRALDDIRLAVRESGETLARTVRGLTIRLCDPTATDEANDNTVSADERSLHERNAIFAAATALRWLLKHGLSQRCPEAAGVCISCLVGVVDVVKSSILQPLLPDLIKSLLLSMSGLEPAALNYLQVRVAGLESNNSARAYDDLERMRLQLAQSGPLATALEKCLQMVPYVSLEAQKAIIPQLDTSLRLSAGFATRAATADTISSLCSSCPDAFRFPGSSSSNPSVRLLRALYFASERERGQAARDKMAHALGSIALLCPGVSVRNLALRACDRYNSSIGNQDDPAARRAAAATLRAIAVRASKQFADGGNSDIWCRRVLPSAYLGMKDPDTKVASLWKEVWEEGGSAANLAGATDDFGNLLEERLLMYLVNECVTALQDVAWSRRVAGSAALSDLVQLNVLAPAPRKVNTATTSNNNNNNNSTISFADQARAKRRAKASNIALSTCAGVITGSRLWSGKAEVVKVTSKIAAKWSTALSDDTINETELFGKDPNDNSSCTWVPLVVAPKEYENDLNVGDNWFTTVHKSDNGEDDTPDEEEAVVAMDVGGGKQTKMDVDADGDEQSGVVDFSKADEIMIEESGDEEIETTVDESKTKSTKEENRDDGNNQVDATTIITFAGICRVLLAQAIQSSSRSHMSVSEEEVLPYRAATLSSLRDLLQSLSRSQKGNEQRQTLYKLLSPILLPVLQQPSSNSTTTKKEAPLVAARSIECLSACFWDDIGENSRPNTAISVKIQGLTSILQELSSESQPAWTVREAAALGCAELVTRCHMEELRNHGLISGLLECVAQALKNLKFWRIRHAGLKLLQALVDRCGNTGDTLVPMSISVMQNEEGRQKQLILEAMLPHKEIMLKLARKALKDSESSVTALSTEILGTMSWWP